MNMCYTFFSFRVRLEQKNGGVDRGGRLLSLLLVLLLVVSDGSDVGVV